ncbi:MAG: serine/threonine-protein phosphatase [Propionibacterium sp.]|nr:serine/threonine-protein phosphatase [Propionibacterium sp.]
MAWRFKFVAHSEIGLVRKNNQDSGYATDTLLVVADGMGGAAAGDLASAAAIDRIRRIEPPEADDTPADVEQAPEPETEATDDDAPADAGTGATTGETDSANPWADAEDDPEREGTPGEQALVLLAGAISRANDRLADLIADDHALDGMGTTVSAVMLADQQYAVAHIGDSRAYLWRDETLHRLTHDHSWVQSLVDEGRLTEEEANYHPHRSLLLRVLNGQPQYDPDLALHDAEPGDRLLVCSDGLCGFVPDEVLADRLREPDADEAMAALVKDAHLAGGSDNITIILADLVDETAAVGIEPVVLGAANEREIPAVGVRPKVDLGDDRPGPPPTVDEHGNPVPAAPAPKRRGDAEEERYAPRRAPSRRNRWGRALLVLLAVLLVLGGAAGGTYAWARTQYFVAPDRDQVGIYRGLNERFGSYRLHELHESYDIAIADLPNRFRDQLAGGITADNLDGARATVRELRSAAEFCREVRAQRERTPTPEPTPDTTPTPSPSPSGTPAGPTVRQTPGTASPDPSASPSPGPASPSPDATGSPTTEPDDGDLPPYFDENDC